MHGLIFVTWEKYLVNRFNTALFNAYRAKIGENTTNAPLASKVYDDAMLLAGVAAVHELTHVPVDTLLREYGHYFLTNGLTSSRCSYLLTQVHSGRDLLLVMRDAHAQMRRVPDGLTPPVFGYEAVFEHSNSLTLIYDSSRQLCPVLWGAIEGAAERYGQQVRIHEKTCMRQGYDACRFDVTFLPAKNIPNAHETPEQIARRKQQQQVDNLVLSLLPSQQGVTLTQLQGLLQMQGQVPATHQRLSRILESLQHLSHAGLVAHTANQPGDTLTNRKYWRAPTFDL
ncbi:heme NO-binding domain-containing protein [Ktedonobacteria bacterium brp13]|nr:heme NO-binding domain-containing protein [Ktedonobacteria bacterium brp13]